MAEPGIKVTLNGIELEFDVQPQLINDRTMVPMRKIFESMDTSVEWQEDTQTILAIKDDIVITMQIGNNVININGTDFELDVPPQLVNDRTLIPVRAIAESLEAQVDWDEDTQTVIITNEDTQTATVTNEDDKPFREAEFYEENTNIPDYGSVNGVEALDKFGPQDLIDVWQYIYEYDESGLEDYRNYLLEMNFTELRGSNPLYYSNGIEGLYIKLR